MAEKTGLKVPKKLQSFEEVQRALQDIEASLNKLSSSVNAEAEGEITDKDGKSGDTRVTQNKDKSYMFEIKTSEGWKTPVIGKSSVKFKSKPGERSKIQTKSIDELQASDDSTGDTIAKKTIYDEKADKFVLARPDYDSGWIDVSNDDVKHTLTHDLGCLPIMYIAWFTPDSTYNDGYPTKCYPMVNGMIRHGGTEWSGVELLFNSTEVQYTCDASHHVYTNYRLDSGGDSWTDYNDGYMRLALWK